MVRQFGTLQQERLILIHRPPLCRHKVECQPHTPTLNKQKKLKREKNNKQHSTLISEHMELNGRSLITHVPGPDSQTQRNPAGFIVVISDFSHQQEGSVPHGLESQGF